MDALPRLPMLIFEMRLSPESTSFSNLKLFIQEYYNENVNSYSKELYDLETLRNFAVRPSLDMDGCVKMKRYYAQLNSLLKRFPSLKDRNMLNFNWKSASSNKTISTNDIKDEMNMILVNLAALHTQLGTMEGRIRPESMKLACTHFQCAAGALEMIKDNDSVSELNCADFLTLAKQICLGQSQECILEKSLSDNRKASIVAKVAAQIVQYYNSALAILLANGENGPLLEEAGSKLMKKWKKYLMFKCYYVSVIIYIYQGQSSEESKQWGERVMFYQLANDKLSEALKEANGIFKGEQVQKALSFIQNVVEDKLKVAKYENEFIYHFEIPDVNTTTAIQGANLVHGITFNPTENEYLNQDIFQRLVPIEAHESSSLYSEEKAIILRSIHTRAEQHDADLNAFMNSLNLDFLHIDGTIDLPQTIVDRCASLNARPNVITDLVNLMKQLADCCSDVEAMLRETNIILLEEDQHEKEYRQAMGTKPSVHFGELNREYQKYQEAHNKAGESNDTLRKAMGMHVANLKTLAKPLIEIQCLIPQVGNDKHNDSRLVELRSLLDKVTQMSSQRNQLLTSLRNDMNADDITSKIVTTSSTNHRDLFKIEIGKHEKAVLTIETNFSAQTAILRALTDCYAHCAPLIKILFETKHKRDQFFASLVASYDVYEDLLGKTVKGLEFYKKLQYNVQKMFTRIKSARDVQKEERQQRLKFSSPTEKFSVNNLNIQSEVDVTCDLTTNPVNIKGLCDESIITMKRPSPLGSESTSTAPCATFSQADPGYINPIYNLVKSNEAATSTYSHVPASNFNHQYLTSTYNTLDKNKIPDKCVNSGYLDNKQYYPVSSFDTNYNYPPTNIPNNTIDQPPSNYPQPFFQTNATSSHGYYQTNEPEFSNQIGFANIPIKSEQMYYSNYGSLPANQYYQGSYAENSQYMYYQPNIEAARDSTTVEQTYNVVSQINPDKLTNSGVTKPTHFSNTQPTFNYLTKPLNQLEDCDTPLDKRESVGVATNHNINSTVDLLSDIDDRLSTVSLIAVPLQPEPVDMNVNQNNINISSTKPEFPPENITALEQLSQDQILAPTNVKACIDSQVLTKLLEYPEPTESLIDTAKNHPEESKIVKNDNPKFLPRFHMEVERLEKFVESLNKKVLSGSTSLDNKWTELKVLLQKESSKRTTQVARLFPEKNYCHDCIPFDHARVKLPTDTDDYINACFVQDLGVECPMIILSQTPLQSTVIDFWQMIFTQKPAIVLSLHTFNEITYPFWPTECNVGMFYGDFILTLEELIELPATKKYILKITSNESEIVHNLLLLEAKTSTKMYSAAQLVYIGRDIVSTYKQLPKDMGSSKCIVVQCITGGKHAPLVSVAIASAFATKSVKPVLINVIDTWYRILCQRQGILADKNELELSYQVVLWNAHDYLNKNGIVTSYQMRNAEMAVEKAAAKDPFNDLDPLWKLNK